MALMKLTITYKDGRRIEAFASPEAQVMTEDFIGFSDEHKVKAGYYLAWAALYTDGKESSEFAAWLKTIADIDETEAEEVDPTPPARLADSSSD